MMRFVSAACVAVFLLAVGVSARADDQKELKDLVAKAIKAHGGAENIAKQKTTIFKGKGKVYLMGDDGIPYTGTWSVQEPDRIRVEIEGAVGGQAFKFISVVDKDKGWLAIGEMVMDADKDHMTESREEMHAQRIASLRGLSDKDCKLSTVGEAKINDKPAIGVRVECTGYQDVTLFFDKETSQLVKLERRAKDADAGNTEFTSETFYSDYKKVNGVQMAHKHVLKRDGKLYVDHEITEIEIQDKLDDKLFKKP